MDLLEKFDRLVCLRDIPPEMASADEFHEIDKLTAEIRAEIAAGPAIMKPPCDLRMTPRIGDILRKGPWQRKICDVIHCGPFIRSVRYERIHEKTGFREMRHCYKVGWLRWAATAEVVHVSEAKP